MRFRAWRLFVYVSAVLAGRALAQPTLIADEMPHVELSVGAGAMEHGPGVDLERRMVDLGLSSRLGRSTYPNTSPPSLVPGVFAQVSVGLTEHAMLGFFIGADETATIGRRATSSVIVTAEVKTRALLAAYRPTPWFKVATGPALLERRLTFGGVDQSFGGRATGWLTTADLTFARRQLTAEHPATFWYLTGQHRRVPAVQVSGLSVPLPADRSVLVWPSQRVRANHWMVGIGVGIEI